MSNKLIAFVVNTMSDNDNRLFMLDELKQSNIDFEVYDLSPLIFGKSNNSKYCTGSIFKDCELLELLKQERHFIIYFQKHIRYRLIFNMLEKYSSNNYYQIINGKILSGTTCKKSLSRILLKVFNKYTLVNLMYRKFTKDLHYKLFESGISKDGIEIPSFEYDNYLKMKNKKGEFKKDYHVFLDSDLAYHRDVKLYSAKTILNPEKYYQELQMFFDKIEKETNKEVVIALHPRTQHKKYNFGKRKIVQSNTAELLWDADLILSHHSTALHYAIIYNKDLIILTTNELEKSDILCSLERFEKALDVSRININNFNDFTNIYKYTNQEKYAQYKLDNIISNNVEKDKLGSDIIVEYFNKVLNKS